MMTVRSDKQANPEAARTRQRVVEVMGPPRLTLRERVERARQATEGAALERLRRDVCRREQVSQ